VVINSSFARALAGHLLILLGQKHARDLSNNLIAQAMKFQCPGALSVSVYFTTVRKL